MNAHISHLMGLAMDYIQKSDLDGAERLLKQALKMAPKNSEILRLLGIIYAFRGEPQEALKMFDRSIKANPNNFLAHSNRGNILKDLHRYELALKSFDRSIALQPDYAEAYNNKGNLLQSLKKFDSALENYDRAIDLRPNYAEVYGNVGNALQCLNLYSLALDAYSKGISLGLDSNKHLDSLTHSKMRICSWSGINKLFEEIVDKSNSGAAQVHPFCLSSYIDDPFLIKEVTEAYVLSKHPDNSELLGAIPFAERRNKLRIGYFSADFRNHPVAFLIAGVIEAHNRDKFEVIGFSTSLSKPDEMTARLQVSFDKFIDVALKSDKQVCELARELGIDIAVDLGGLTQDARPGIFATRTAPIQIGYIGYLGTMGAPYMDYIIADEVIVPKELQSAYSEKIIYLPSYQANDSRVEISDHVFTREELGLPRNGFVFCCFNNSYKFTPDIFDSWARILANVEDSVLLLYAENDDIKTNLGNEIELRGISKERLVFGARLPRPDYLARYRTADLFLDTSPYNAGATASDSLRSGLPVLTLLGQSFSARMSASLLRAIGLPELITSSRDEYELLAISLGSNPNILNGIKTKLIRNRESMPLFDTVSFTENLESAYRVVYERWQDGLSPEHVWISSSNMGSANK